MKKITITVTLNVSGHGSIGLIPSNYSQWIVSGSGSRDFNLDPDDYTITYLMATAGGGSITITEGGTQLGQAILSPGVDGGTIDITVI